MSNEKENKNLLNGEQQNESENENQKRRKTLWIAGAIALIAVCGIGGYALMSQNQDKLIPKENIVYELGDKVDLDC